MKLFPPQSFNEVKCSGEKLSAVLWQGRQWAVTDYGLECRNGHYYVEAQNFRKSEAAKGWREHGYNWARHIGQKSWCDIDDLEDALTAFNILFDEHGKRTCVPAPSIQSHEDAEVYALAVADEAYRSAIKSVSRTVP